jgi:hypothetical protein
VPLIFKPSVASLQPIATKTISCAFPDMEIFTQEQKWVKLNHATRKDRATNDPTQFFVPLHPPKSVVYDIDLIAFPG